MFDLADRRRTIAVTVAIVTAVSGVVVFLRSILPEVPGPFLPGLFSVLAAGLLVVGRRLVRSARVGGARVAAAWAGIAAALAVLGGANAMGLGGGLVAILLAVLLVNTGIALWFRSGLHFAATQWVGFAWSIVAFVYGVVPLPAVVLAVAGLWWIGAVGFSLPVVVSTTLLLPLTVALSLHPVTHSSPAIDAADVATVAGLTAAALLLGARTTRAQVYPAVWPAMRRTAVIALAAQTLIAGTPPFASALAPADPWPGLWWGAAVLLAAVAVASLSTLRPGGWAALGWAAILWLTIAVDLVAGVRWGCLLAFAVLVVSLLSSVARQGGLTSSSLLRLTGAAALCALGLVLLAPPASIASIVLLATAALMLAVSMGRRDIRVGILR